MADNILSNPAVSGVPLLRSFQTPPTLPEAKAHDRIDKHDRRLTDGEAKEVLEDLSKLPGQVRNAPRNPPTFHFSSQLEALLKETVKGEVRFDRGSRALYATDASNYRQVPIGVVVPTCEEDIISTVAACREFGAPILSRGGGTSLAGQCCNTAIVMDMSKYYNRILEMNPEAGYAIVEPGIVLDALRNEAEKHKLTFGPDPATHDHCTLGGMIGNNSCGLHAQMAGRTEHNVEALEVLTYSGQRFWVGPTTDEELNAIIRVGDAKAEIYAKMKELRDRNATRVRDIFPRIPRKVSGYNLDELLPENGFNVARALVGTESTCVTVLKAKLKLVPSPQKRTLVILGFRDVFTAADNVAAVLKFKPIALEGMDITLIEHMRRKNLEKDDLELLPNGNGWLLVEFGSNDENDLQKQVTAFSDAFGNFDEKPDAKILTDSNQQMRIWDIREAGLGATARVPGERETWEGWEDSAVPPEKVGEYLRKLHALYEKYGYTGALYGHFGQGCIHTRIDFDLVSRAGIDKYREFIHEAAHLVVSLGGSLSGEHGDGQSRGELLPIMFGTDLVQAFREFKYAWDPTGKMNPGKVVDPYKVDQNLRLGTHYNPPVWKTKFSFAEDNGSFIRATTRCVGVGACRRASGGVMCPSYMVTKEEKHSTRGRARMLFEMLEGNPLKQSWREEKVKEALDLCLSCKGCKGDCPVNVDMATYKAEFLSHYYKGRLRPMSAYSMGLIYWWARLGSLLPRLVNRIASSPLFAPWLKSLGGISQKRAIPQFAKRTFRSWFEARQPRNPRGPDVILWADTFNNHFNPEIAKDAVEVLEAAGFNVRIPRKQLCCGRPLYDYGMLDLARHMLSEILGELRESIQAGVPIVGLEPSCTAVFRDELTNLIPNDVNAQRLKAQTFLFGEFVHQHSERFEALFSAAATRGPAGQKALVHVHCHQSAVIGSKADLKVLEKLGFDVKALDSGCCGMAGSFGFEKDHYDVSVACGERSLLPSVRGADTQTLVITNGFSCREQIDQLAGRETLHMAQVLARAFERVSGQSDSVTISQA